VWLFSKKYSSGVHLYLFLSGPQGMVRSLLEHDSDLQLLNNAFRPSNITETGFSTWTHTRHARTRINLSGMTSALKNMKRLPRLLNLNVQHRCR
jgi:hypothetical protein